MFWHNLRLKKFYDIDNRGATIRNRTTCSITTLSTAIVKCDTEHNDNWCWVLLIQLRWVSLFWMSSCWMSWRQPQVFLPSYFEETLDHNICPARRHAFRSDDFSSNAFLPTDPIELKYQNDCRHWYSCNVIPSCIDVDIC